MKFLPLFIYSLPYFNLSLMGIFTWLTPPGPYRATTCSERELTLDHIHAILITQGHGGPPLMRHQLNAGATSEIHTIHAPINANNTNMKGWLWRPNDIRGPCGPKASWHLSYRWGKTPKKTTQETCPDRGSNPGPLRDRRACCRLLHSGALSSFVLLKLYFFSNA